MVERSSGPPSEVFEAPGLENPRPSCSGVQCVEPAKPPPAQPSWIQSRLGSYHCLLLKYSILPSTSDMVHLQGQGQELLLRKSPLHPPDPHPSWVWWWAVCVDISVYAAPAFLWLFTWEYILSKQWASWWTNVLTGCDGKPVRGLDGPVKFYAILFACHMTCKTGIVFSEPVSTNVTWR